MPLSTVRRESLIPPAYLVSIALLLTVAFIVLMPSRETFTFSDNTQSDETYTSVDDLDLAYLKAREAAGDLQDDEVRNVIHNMIRGKNWQQAQQLMADRPDIEIDPNDDFLLRLEIATAGYIDEENTVAHTASHEAKLTELLTQFIDTPSLQDKETLLRAAQISVKLKQPELSASYNRLLADADPDNAVSHLEQCARILAYYEIYVEAEGCYRSAISKSTDNDQQFTLKIRLIQLLVASGDTFTATEELESLVSKVPGSQHQYIQLAELALASERPDLAYPLYARLSTIDETRAVYWLEKAATWAEASNLPGLAAEYVLTITDLSDAKYTAELAKRRQTLLLAAGRNEEALQTLHERIRAQPNSGELLEEGIKLSTGLGLTAQAMDWNEDFLAIRPFDIDAMERQVNFTLGNKQLDQALLWAQKLVEVDPLAKTHRLKLAQLEEWNGNVQAAQLQRMWLAENHPSTAHDRELIRLAELNWDAGTAANALRRIAGRENLNTENIMKLVKLYEQDGRPDLAGRALTDMLDGSPRDAMLLRELAALQKHHNKYEESLKAWQTFAARFGRSNEESINQMELYWRLKMEPQALAAAVKINPQYLPNASEYQLKLLTELGWRHRKPDMVIAATPYLQRLDMDEYDRVIANRRMIQSFIDKDDPIGAIEHAEEIWRITGEVEFLMISMHIALDEDIYPHKERFLDANDNLIALRSMPEYWLSVADYYNRQQDMEAALETYQNTLAMLPNNSNAISGIIWTLLGNDADDETLSATLMEYEEVAAEIPELWSPYAVGYMKVKNPQASLRWFSKLMVNDDHDYNVLLTFAEALEQTGNINHSYKVRNYALAKLRPLALAEADDKTNDIARDYVGLLQSHGSAGENELWTQRLLADQPDDSESESAWRREMATSWYLATQQSDYARLIMTKMHEKRLQSPVWQQLALALQDDDIGAIQEILASGKDLSSNDRILALRKVGQEKEAYKLARNTMDNSNVESERSSAKRQMLAMRSYRPGFYTAAVKQHDIGNLNITESGLSLRNTLAEADLGFAVEYKRNQMTSKQLAVSGDIEDDVTVSAYFGNSTRGGRLTTGMNTRGEDDLQYSSGTAYISDLAGRKRLSTEVSINETGDGSPAYRIAAKQDRAEVSYQHALGKSEFIKLSGSMNEVSTRDSDEQISKGMGGSIELGTQGSFGSNKWTMGLIASGNSNEASATLPINADGIPVFSQRAIKRTDDSRQLALSASLFRGGINPDYPQAASPRYHMSARVGQNWPDDSLAVKVQAGAGFRLLGNDELSFQLVHDRSVDLEQPDSSNSTFGIQYRNHF